MTVLFDERDPFRRAGGEVGPRGPAALRLRDGEGATYVAVERRRTRRVASWNRRGSVAAASWRCGCGRLAHVALDGPSKNPDKLDTVGQAAPGVEVRICDES